MNEEKQFTEKIQPIDETQPKAEASLFDEFEELQTAPPKEKIKLSWVGKTAIAIIVIWIIIAFIGPFIAPFHEADMIADDSFLPADGQFWLGSDYIGRDILSRILWGARTTIGISFVSTLAAYFFGITLGIAAAVRGGWTDIVLSRVNEAFLSLPTIMVGLIIIAALGSSILILVLSFPVVKCGWTVMICYRCPVYSTVIYAVAGLPIWLRVQQPQFTILRNIDIEVGKGQVVGVIGDIIGRPLEFYFGIKGKKKGPNCRIAGDGGIARRLCRPLPDGTFRRTESACQSYTPSCCKAGNSFV